MRAVLDVNVLVAALLARDSAPARLVSRWLVGDYELIISRKLISELKHALSYPKLRSRVALSEASVFVNLLETSATRGMDADKSPRRSRDPGDDYLIALAASSSAFLTSGDRDLLDLRADFPIYSPSQFLATLGK